MDELVIPSDQMLPLLESLTRHFKFIDDQFEPPKWNPTIDIRNIKIIPLKRKKPEPKLPYREPYPTLNQNSEPNVELLSNAITISLKNFLRMEEEAFIFPSDIDAEIRALKARFGDALEVLGRYLKEKTKGRGMEILSQVMDFAEHAHAPRLTNYNHEEDLLFSEHVLAAIQENVKQAFEEAKRIVAEEAEAERLASEAEIKRLADEEAFKVAMEMAVRFAEVELEKINQEKSMVPHQDRDIIMIEQAGTTQASDRGKNVVVDSTPPSSPVRTVRDFGSPSSAIPAAVQAALDDIKAEVKTELSDIRAEMKADGQATNEEMDKIMDFLQDLASRFPKP
jgi:hypothetical protein